MKNENRRVGKFKDFEFVSVLNSLRCAWDVRQEINEYSDFVRRAK
jgi:hypothetical protein